MVHPNGAGRHGCQDFQRTLPLYSPPPRSSMPQHDAGGWGVQRGLYVNQGSPLAITANYSGPTGRANPPTQAALHTHTLPTRIYPRKYRITLAAMSCKNTSWTGERTVADMKANEPKVTLRVPKKQPTLIPD
jgi:hypothetical protein